MSGVRRRESVVDRAATHRMTKGYMQFVVEEASHQSLLSDD